MLYTCTLHHTWLGSHIYNINFYLSFKFYTHTHTCTHHHLIHTSVTHTFLCTHSHPYTHSAKHQEDNDQRYKLNCVGLQYHPCPQQPQTDGWSCLLHMVTSFDARLAGLKITSPERDHSCPYVTYDSDVEYMARRQEQI